MRRMKDSNLLGIGNIPADWEVIKAKFVLSYVKRPPQNSSKVVTCFRDGTVTLRSNKREEGFTFSDKEIGYQQIYVGDFVFHGMDGFAGAIGVSDSFGKSSPVLIVCEQNKKSSNKYYCYYFRNLANNNVFEDAGNGIRIRSCDIRWNKLGNMYIAVPPLSIQHRIADYLDNKCAEIDRSMDLVRQSMDKLKAYKMSVITEAVTKGLDPSVPMKDSGVPWIGEVPEGWKISSVRWEFDNLDGRRRPISAENRVITHGSYDYYGASGIIDKIDEYIFDEPLILIGEDGANLALRNLPLIYIATGKYWVNNHAHILKPKAQNALYYMAYQLECVDLFHFITGSTQPKLTQANLSKIPVVCPSLAEQLLITAHIDTKCAEIDAVIAKKQELLDKLAAYKKSLIFECVTGKREVVA